MTGLIPHAHPDWARPSHTCTTGAGRPCHTCDGTALATATSAPGLRSPVRPALFTALCQLTLPCAPSLEPMAGHAPKCVCHYGNTWAKPRATYTAQQATVVSYGACMHRCGLHTRVGIAAHTWHVHTACGIVTWYDMVPCHSCGIRHAYVRRAACQVKHSSAHTTAISPASASRAASLARAARAAGLNLADEYDERTHPLESGTCRRLEVAVFGTARGHVRIHLPHARSLGMPGRVAAIDPTCAIPPCRFPLVARRVQQRALSAGGLSRRSLARDLRARRRARRKRT